MSTGKVRWKGGHEKRNKGFFQTCINRYSLHMDQKRQQ